MQDGLEQLTGYLMRRAYVVVGAHTRRLLPSGVHAREVVLLSLVDDLGPLSGRDIGDLTELNRTLVVRLVDAVEARDWARRAARPQDRRSYALTLTPVGAAVLPSLRSILDDVDVAFRATLSPAESARLHGLLRALLDDAPVLRAGSLAARSSFLAVVAHRQLRARGAAALSAIGLHPRDFGALSVLARCQARSQADLAAQMGVTPPGVVGLVDDLEHRGLLVRARRADDRRVLELRLTTHGAATLDEARRIAGEVQAGIADRLGAEGDERLRELLARCV